MKKETPAGASATQTAANSPSESHANPADTKAPEEGKTDEKPFVIKLQAPSKKPAESSKQATTVHLDPVPSEKIQDKKEEQPKEQREEKEQPKEKE